MTSPVTSHISKARFKLLEVWAVITHTHLCTCPNGFSLPCLLSSGCPRAPSSNPDSNSILEPILTSPRPPRTPSLPADICGLVFPFTWHNKVPLALPFLPWTETDGGPFHGLCIEPSSAPQCPNAHPFIPSGTIYLGLCLETGGKAMS